MSATSAEQVITPLCRSPSSIIASGVEKCPFEIVVHPPAALIEVIRAFGKCPIGVLADITTTTYVFSTSVHRTPAVIASYIAKSECDFYRDVK
jgi:hypothetical protein